MVYHHFERVYKQSSPFVRVNNKP